MPADQVDTVIGINAHHDTHTASVVTPLGAEPAHLQLDASSAADCLEVCMTPSFITTAQRMDNARQVTMSEIALSCGVTPMTIDRHSRTGPVLDHVTHQGCLLSVAR